jgi:MFS family permease
VTNPYIAQPVPPAVAPRDGKSVARRILAVLGSLGGALIGFVFAVIWIFTVPRVAGQVFALNGWQIALILAASVFALTCPVILFAVLSNWNFAPSSEGQAYLRRWIWWLLGVEAASIVGLVAAGLTTRVASWLPITLVILAVVFMGVGILLGRALRSPQPPAVPLILGPWAPVKPGAWFWWIVAAIALIPAIGLLFLIRPWQPPIDKFSTIGVTTYFSAVGFFTVVAGFACIIRYAVFVSRMKPAVTRDFVLRQKVSRAILRSKPMELSPDELEFARRNAVVIRLSIPWQIGYLVLFLVGIALEEVPTMVSRFSPGPWFVVIILVVAVIFAGIFARYIVRADRFLAINGQPTVVPVPPAQYPVPYQMQPPQPPTQ